MVDFAELHCLSNFTFLRGASHPEELVERAAGLGYKALALTDECSVAGVVRAHLAAREHAIQLIVGSEFRLTDGLRLVLLARDRKGYGQLSALITLARRRAPKGEYRLDREDLESNPLDGCLVLWLPEDAPIAAGGAHGSGCLPMRPGVGSRVRDRLRQGCRSRAYREVFMASPEAGSPRQAGPAGIARHPSERAASSETDSRNRQTGLWLVGLFPGRAWIGVGLFLDGRDRERLAERLALAKATGLPAVACNDVHMHDRGRQPLQDTLTAIRLGKPLSALGHALFANGECHLRPLARLARLYPKALLDESCRLAERCRFSLDELRYEYPRELVPEGETPATWLRRLTEEGARRRWPEGTPDKVRRQIEHELALIAEMAYEPFFLTVHDIVGFARARDILCQGRGSAANSAVCYALGITEVDPARLDLLFERFVSKERGEPPDIDVDFEHERREEVIQYIYGKYGRHRAALAASVITYRTRSAVRDVGKALGVSPDPIERLVTALEVLGREVPITAILREAGLDPDNSLNRRWLALVDELRGFPRHLSQHVGGFVIAADDISWLVPVENAAMAERTVIQWDKDDLEALGLLKVDILALGMLTVIRKALDSVSRYQGRPLTLANIPSEDPEVYAMLQRGDSMGVFQVESRAQMTMLPRLKPRCYYDLVIEIAIVRPGPIQGDMVHPYLARRAGLEPVTYPSPEVREVLARTLGVPIFQEQVMRLAMVAAGFSAGEADQLRRAMAAWRRKGDLEKFEAKLLRGMAERGYSEAFARQVYKQIKGFGEYGFPESHSASFALLAYASAWLKRHHPAAFLGALLNSQPMGFYAPAQLVQDARRHGVTVLPVAVNCSGWDCVLEPLDVGSASLPSSFSSTQGAGQQGHSVSTKPQAPAWSGVVCLETRREYIPVGSAAASLPQMVSNQTTPFQASTVGGRQIGGSGDSSGRVSHRGNGSRAGGTPRPGTVSPVSPSLPPPDEFSAGAGMGVRLGLRLVKGLSEGGALALLKARRDGPFRNVQDLATRAALVRRDLECLAAADALVDLCGNRHRTFWAVSATETPMPLFPDPAVDEAVPLLTPPREGANIVADYASTGLTLRRHPLALLRDRLVRRGICMAKKIARIPSGTMVRTAGLVICRQRPLTASGVTFITLEDETGQINLIVWPSIAPQQRKALLQATLLAVTGVVQRGEGTEGAVESAVTHVVAGKLEDLSSWLGRLEYSCRDFR